MTTQQDQPSKTIIASDVDPETGRNRYAVVIVGPGMTYDGDPQGELTGDRWRTLELRLADICMENLTEIPAQWQRKCVSTWQPHRDGGQTVLDRCRELVTHKLQTTPDDPLHADIRLHAWLCGALPAAKVPRTLAEYQDAARTDAGRAVPVATAWRSFMRAVHEWLRRYDHQSKVVTFLS